MLYHTEINLLRHCFDPVVEGSKKKNSLPMAGLPPLPPVRDSDPGAPLQKRINTLKRVVMLREF